MVLRASVSPAELESLVSAARAGEEGALRRLVAQLLTRVRNLVRYLVRGDADVEDLAQDALVEVVRGLPSYRGDGSFEGWVHRVVTRSVFAELRRRRADAGARDHAAREAVEPDGLFVIAPDGRPDAYLERRRIVRALDQLPDEQRHALVLHHAVEMSVPEIAEALGVPFETVRSRLRLARARLRTLLEEEEAK
jgi:RNA polymerase sigma-70 factor (ECF subfamily)